MHIKQIIVEGFKTYKLRTVIDPFHAGHNAIRKQNLVAFVSSFLV